MKKSFAKRFTSATLKIAVLFFGLVGISTGTVYASHSVNFTANTTLSGDWNSYAVITVLASSEAESIAVTASTITLVVPNGHNLTLSSSTDKKLTNNLGIVTNCGVPSTLFFSGSSGATEVVVTPSDTPCTPPGGAPRRHVETGGGGGTPPPAPVPAPTPTPTPTPAPIPTVETPTTEEAPVEAEKKVEKKVTKKTNPRAVLKRTEFLEMVAGAALKEASALSKYARGEKTSVNVNHAEALKILFDAFGIKPPRKAATAPYKDVSKNSWYAPYVEKAKSLGLLTDKTFKTKFSPSAKIKRGVLEGMLKALQSK